MALENARLQAELKAQLTLVEDSRARIVAAGDEQRRRIERDLHDGAQQRLVAIALELRSAQRRMGGDLDPAVEQLLTSTVDDLQVAVEELRELAHGIHPTILAEGGLAAALDTLASRSPLPVTVDATPRALRARRRGRRVLRRQRGARQRREARERHARDGCRALRERDTRIEVADDGGGGASLDAGTGLRGLADRVEARGGLLRVESPPSGGTRIVAEMPCAS